MAREARLKFWAFQLALSWTDSIYSFLFLEMDFLNMFHSCIYSVNLFYVIMKWEHINSWWSMWPYHKYWNSCIAYGVVNWILLADLVIPGEQIWWQTVLHFHCYKDPSFENWFKERSDCLDTSFGINQEPLSAETTKW